MEVTGWQIWTVLQVFQHFPTEFVWSRCLLGPVLAYPISFAALHENLYTNCSQSFDLNSARHRLPPFADRCPHYAHLPQSEPYYYALFRSGSIHVWHDFAFDQFPLPRTGFTVERRMRCTPPTAFYIPVRWRYYSCSHSDAIARVHFSFGQPLYVKIPIVLKELTVAFIYVSFCLISEQISESQGVW